MRTNNLRKYAALLPAILVSVGLLGALIFIFYSSLKSQKGFGDLSVPLPSADREASPQDTSSSAAHLPSVISPLIREPAKTSVRNQNVQLKKDPSQEDIDAYIAEIKRVAVSASTVKIDGCEPDPVVVKAASLSSLSFVNNDAIIHLITVEDKKFAIQAHGTQKIPMSFASGTGIYNYDCDSNFSVGTFLVE